MVKNNIGIQFTELNERNNSIYLTTRRVSIDFVAIGKGYTADKLIEFWKNKFSLRNGVIDAGGHFVKLNSEKGMFVFVPNPRSLKDTKFKIEVYSNSIVTRDAFATAITVLGKKTGLNLVNQLPGVEAIIILSSGDAFYSKGVIHYND